MMSSDTKEAVSLKTTSLDARKANTKTLESEKIIVDGSDLKELIDNNTFKRTDLVNRFEIEDGDYYILWDDNGLPVEWKLNGQNDPNFSFNTAIKKINCSYPTLTNSYRLFCNMDSLEIIESCNVESLKNASQICTSCPNLKEANFTFNGLKDASMMFISCPKLEIVTGDFSNVTNIFRTFQNTNIKKLYIDLSKVENGNNAFYNCKSLTEYIFPNSYNLKNIGNMFTGCSSLKKFEVGSLINVEGDVGNAFNECDFESFEYDMPNISTQGNLFANNKSLKTVKISFDKLTRVQWHVCKLYRIIRC